MLGAAAKRSTFTLRSVYSSSVRNASSKYDVVVIGGGSAGIGLTASWLKHKTGSSKSNGETLSFAIIEPAEDHYYQPLWTLIGGNTNYGNKISEKTEKLIPEGAKLVKDKVTTFHPEQNEVELSNGDKISYDVLVVAAGVQINFDATEGLVSALEDSDSSVCSNYDHHWCNKTSKLVKEFQGGNALFTFPTGPVKCAGAPQKIMYLADAAWTAKNLDYKANFYSSLPKIFAVEKYRVALEALCNNRNLTRHFGHRLIKVMSDKKQAVFKVDHAIRPDISEETVTVDYDFIHVTPEMGAPNFLKGSPISDAAGFVDVNKETLQSNKYPNIFALGDCSNVPTSKTLSAITGQLGVVRYHAGKVLDTREVYSKDASKDFAHFREGEGPIYDGYTACPIPTGYHEGIIAEFDYDAQPLETFFWDQSVPSKANGLMKEFAFPQLYWNFFLKGDWTGPWKFRQQFAPLKRALNK